MIADFLVDYEYLASCLDTNDVNDNFVLLKILQNFVEYGNARMIVDKKKTCLEPMRKLHEKLRK